ncbi:hypothetical protein CTI14_56440, partial [Methylobacterium radiotolerans]
MGRGLPDGSGPCRLRPPRRGAYLRVPLRVRDQAITALSRGLHVVVDKPSAPSVEDAQVMIDAAAASGVVLTVFQNRRWDGDFLTVADLVGSGRLGEVHTFESRFE